MDLFIQQTDGKKIGDPESQVALCSRLKEEMVHPLRVIIANRGPDIELLVANPVELCGKGRPLVFYDVTLALKKLRVSIFAVRICSEFPVILCHAPFLHLIISLLMCRLKL